MAHLEGYVSHIRFHNEENGYTVMDIETTHGDEVLVGIFIISMKENISVQKVNMQIIRRMAHSIG